MAIASILIHVDPSHVADIFALLSARSDITDIQYPKTQKKEALIALVLETQSDQLLSHLNEIKEIPGVFELHLVFADYEDDLL